VKDRRFLFLQGVASPFFARLADRLRAAGAEIQRVNFCGGDALYWGRRPHWTFRTSCEGLEGFLRERFDRCGFTDFVLFGDQRPVHRPAIALARQHGARVHVFEEGYLRPNWITLERDGVNGASSLPRDPDWYRRAAAGLPQYGDGRPVQPNLRVRAAHDFAYHVANIANPLIFPGYRTHRPVTAAAEYAGWARRFAPLPWRRRRDRALIAQLHGARTPYYLLPLQLNADYQIVRHSPFRGMAEVIDFVVRSFARHAPPDTCLVIKNHPLDTGLVDYRRQLAGLAGELGLGGRLHYLETGHLPTLFDHALGTVTVNSTVGLSAILHRNPTCTLGRSIYNLPGLTHQDGLDSFWPQLEPPDRTLFRAFRNVVIHTTQVNGDFYTAYGIRMAVENSLRMLGETSPLQACKAALAPKAVCPAIEAGA
jgi:capsular polysaccharide export protein